MLLEELRSGPHQDEEARYWQTNLLFARVLWGHRIAHCTIVYAEPTGWFDGNNLLRSKLPIVMQVNVRRMREAWAKGVGK